MFLPTRIDHPYRRVPYVTNALLGANIVVFLLTWGRIERAVDVGGLRSEEFALHRLVAHMFLHAGLFHLVGNMLFLAVYGRYVEERLGWARYLAAYLLFGLAGAAAYCAFDDGVAVGASGAISGLMGFVLVAAPWAEVRVVYLLAVYVRSFSVAAFWLVGLDVVFEILRALTAPPWSDVAYTAHLGGLAAGAGLAALLRSSLCQGTRWHLAPDPSEGGAAAKHRLRRARRTGEPAEAPEREPPPAHRVRMHSLEGVPSQVAVIKLLMRRCRLEPDDAKERLDAVRAGEAQSFAFPDAAAAEAFAKEARDLGVGVS